MANTIPVSNILQSPKSRQKLVKPAVAGEGQRAKAHRTVVGKTTELAAQALVDIRAFADLIKFHGGWSNFGECHGDLADFITKTQVDSEGIQKLKFEGDEIAAGLRRLVLMPRGHLKSTIGTVLYVLWRIYRNPNIRVLVACNLQTLAYSFIRELRSYFENPEIEHVWNKRPHIRGNLLPAIDKRNRTRNQNSETEAEDKKVIWNNTALQVMRNERYKEPTVYATSVGTTVTGMHFDLIILDDLIDFKNVESETKKVQTEEWIADVESVINPPIISFIPVNEPEFTGQIEDILGGEFLINGTRYAVDDYYAQVIEKQEELGYRCYVRSIWKDESDPSKGYLWHERYNDRVISSLQARLSPRRFASQYLNKVYEKDTALFATECITTVPNDHVYYSGGNLYYRHPGNGRIEQVNPIMAIDPAFSTSKTADDCAIGTGFKLTDGTLVVVDISLDRMLVAEVIKEVKRHALTYGCGRLYCEENGVGKLVPELFKNQANYVNGKAIVVYGHYEQRVKESKIQGVLEQPIAIGKLMFCQRVRDNEKAWKQLGNYPAVRHDDFLDLLVTLFEKSLPSRNAHAHIPQEGMIGNWRLGIDRLLEAPTTEEGLLSGYSQYFTG